MSATASLLGRFGRHIGKPPGYERLVRAIVPPGKMPEGVEVTLHLEKSTFVTRPALPLDWNLFFFGTYEPELRRIMRRVLTPGCVAVDVGANTGWHTVLMASLCGTTGRVLAFEPNPSVMARLRLNLEVNRLTQVELFPVALSDSCARLPFCAPPSHAPSSGDGHVLPSVSGSAADGSIVVEARALDALAEKCRLDRLDLIKIDVEGYEWPVLQGAQHTIARHRPHVLFEHNEDYVARGRGSADAIYAYFARRGYALFEVGRWRRRPIRRNAWPRSCNVWAIPIVDVGGNACSPHR